jgi:hypothetical protein
MSRDAMKKPPEDLLCMNAQAPNDKCSAALEDIRRYGIGRLLEEYPDFLARLLNRLKETDAAGLFSRVPQIAEQSADLLWEGVGYRAGQSQEMKSVLEKADRDLRVNIEASDSSFKSDFVVERGNIRGARVCCTSRMKIFGSWVRRRC